MTHTIHTCHDCGRLTVGDLFCAGCGSADITPVDDTLPF